METDSAIDQCSGIVVIVFSPQLTKVAIPLPKQNPKTRSPVSDRRPANSLPIIQSVIQFSIPAIILPVGKK
jgi:hypothetical protein